MIASVLANNGILPATFRFLGAGWWIVHLIAIPLVGYIGFIIGKKRHAPASTAAGSKGSSDASNQ